MFRAVVRYGRLRHLAELAPEGEDVPAPRPGTACVVRTDRGEELATVLGLATGPEAPARRRGTYLRAASPADVAQGREAEARSENARQLAVAKVRARGLALKVVSVERLFSGERSILYYTAEDRLDLRELARELQTETGTRVELRQIGARERARVCGGTGVCGRTLCCSTFLRELEPVTLRMAKVQGFSLSPDATQGACGRLKCCLRYENPLYEESRALLPRLGTWVEAARASGEVVGLSVLARKVTVATPDGRLVDLFAAEVSAARTRSQRLTPIPPPAGAPGSVPEATPPPPASPEPPSPAKPSVSDRLRAVTRRLLGRRGKTEGDGPDDPSE